MKTDVKLHRITRKVSDTLPGMRIGFGAVMVAVLGPGVFGFSLSARAAGQGCDQINECLYVKGTLTEETPSRKQGV